jgi:hypothetical protein
MAANSNIPSGLVLPAAQIFTCDVSPAYTLESNNSYIAKTIIRIVGCSEIPLANAEGLWNCNLCGNDDEYMQPVHDEDIIRLQYKINSNTIKYYAPFLIDEDDELIETDALTYEIVHDGLGNRYLSIKVIVSAIPVNCFSIKIYGFMCAIDDDALETCELYNPITGEQDAVVTQEKILFCLIQQCNLYNAYYSEPYRKTNDSCEDTVLLKANYSSYDCVGNFYGVLESGGEQYVLSMRVPGTIEKTEFNFEETVVFNQRTTSKQTDTYLFRTHKIPPYVAEQLALIFNSKQVIIDASVYSKANKLSKNNDEGRMWIISTTLVKECDEIDFTCEN